MSRDWKKEAELREEYIRQNTDLYSNILGSLGTYVKAPAALGKLTMQMLLAAALKIVQREVFYKKLTDKAEQVSRMRLIRYAYLAMLHDLKEQKRFRELLELEEEFDYETQAQMYLAGKISMLPSFTSQLSVAPAHIYHNFELLHGIDEAELQKKLTDFLVNTGETGLRVACKVVHNVLHLVIPEGCPMHTDVEKAHLAVFLDGLVKEGYMNPTGEPRVLAMPRAGSTLATGAGYPQPPLMLSPSAPTLTPALTPTGGRKKTALEEEEDAKKAKGLGGPPGGPPLIRGH